MGSIDWKLIAIASTAGIIGATLGTMFMHKKLNPHTVKRILVIILLLMACKKTTIFQVFDKLTSKTRLSFR